MTDAAFELRDWHRISGYLDQALYLEPRTREHWLDELARTQSELASVLRLLLAEREILNAEQFLENSPVAATAVEALQHAGCTVHPHSSTSEFICLFR